MDRAMGTSVGRTLDGIEIVVTHDVGTVPYAEVQLSASQICGMLADLASLDHSLVVGCLLDEMRHQRRDPDTLNPNGLWVVLQHVESLWLAERAKDVTTPAASTRQARGEPGHELF